jgi:sec-independent protein translocase protein TatA
MLNALEPWHLLIIVGVLVVLFGAKRLPGAARSLGQSMRTFRSEMAQDKAETEQPAVSSAPTAR